MNRRDHVIECARAVAALDVHEQHVILDYGSVTPLRRNELPADSRIDLLRAETSSGRWWLTHSYNLAFALARGDYVLKLDADVVLSQPFIGELKKCLRANPVDLMCNRLTLQDWSMPDDIFTTNGLFLCRRDKLSRIGGFNPYIQGWGWDEIDLYSRFFLAGFAICRIPQPGVTAIDHGDDLREQPVPQPGSRRELPWSPGPHDVNATRRLETQNEKNKRVAIASIQNSIEWPTFDDYVDCYARTGQLPTLPPVALFSQHEKDVLAAALSQKLLQPHRFQHMAWRLMQRLGLGPYSQSGAQKLLSACNIDLSLVS